MTNVDIRIRIVDNLEKPSTSKQVCEVMDEPVRIATQIAMAKMINANAMTATDHIDRDKVVEDGQRVLIEAKGHNDTNWKRVRLLSQVLKVK